MVGNGSGVTGLKVKGTWSRGPITERLYRGKTYFNGVCYLYCLFVYSSEVIVLNGSGFTGLRVQGPQPARGTIIMNLREKVSARTEFGNHCSTRLRITLQVQVLYVRDTSRLQNLLHLAHSLTLNALLEWDDFTTTCVNKTLSAPLKVRFWFWEAVKKKFTKKVLGEWNQLIYSLCKECKYDCYM